MRLIFWPGVCAPILLALLAASAPSADVPAPTCGLVSGWTQLGAARAYTADNLFEYMDGNSEGYLLYGFQAMHGVSCRKEGITLVIDISEFGDADSAYGMFTANLDPRQPLAKIGAGGQIVPRRAMFVKGKYYLEIAANPEGDHRATLAAWTAALDKMVAGSTQSPVALSWFPTEDRQSLRLVPESVLGIRLLRRGYAAQYDFGKAFVAIENSPENAAATIAKLKMRFGQTTPAAIADEGFQASDPYLGRICIFRRGRLIGGYANVVDGRDAQILAAALAARLPATLP